MRIWFRLCPPILPGLIALFLSMSVACSCHAWSDACLHNLDKNLTRSSNKSSWHWGESVWGSNSSGTYLHLKGTIYFLEGLTRQNWLDLGKQIIAGGLIPGLILGTRPLAIKVVNTLTEQRTFSNSASFATHLTMSSMALFIHYMAKFENLPNMINAGMWYLIPGMYSEGLAFLQQMSLLPLSDLSMAFLRNAAHYGASSYLLAMYSLIQTISPEYRKSQLFLTNNDARQLFIQFHNQQNTEQSKVVEIHRSALETTIQSNAPGSAIHQLAETMDDIHCESLNITPYSDSAGHWLNLTFATQGDSGLNVHTERVELPIYGFRHVNWLENTLPYKKWKSPDSPPLDDPEYFSLFQDEVLFALSEALYEITSLDNYNLESLSDTPFLAGLWYSQTQQKYIRPVSASRASFTKDQGVVFTLGKSSWLLANHNGLTLTSSPTRAPEELTQYWIPGWVTSLIQAEASSRMRDATLSITRSALYSASKSKNIPTYAPNIDSFYVESRQDREQEASRDENLQRPAYRRMQQRTSQQHECQGQRVIHDPAYTYVSARDQEPSRDSDRRLPSLSPSSKSVLNSNAYYASDSYLNDPIENDTERQIRHEAVRAEAFTTPGKLTFVEQGLKKELADFNSPETRLMDYERHRERNDPQAPISYATFEEARNKEIKGGRLLLPDEHYDAPLYRGGIFADLLPAEKGTNSECYCMEEGLPLYHCSNKPGNCSAVYHVGCLDQLLRQQARRLGARAQNFSKRTADFSINCMQCTKSIPGKTYWFKNK